MKMRKSGLAKARRGFTLIELLVVISIIGILASLILPAVVNARRQGRRVQCLNNLKNVGTGMFQYVTQKGRFPASGYWNVSSAPNESRDTRIGPTLAYQHPNQLLADTSTGWNLPTPGPTGNISTYNGAESGSTPGMKYSWVVELLPFIGQQAIYDAWDFSENQGTGAIGGNKGAYLDNTPGTAKRGNRELGNTYLEVLVCPEDTTTAQSTGSISYVVNGGFAPHWIARLETDPSVGSSTPTVLRQGVTPSISGGGWHRENLRNMGMMFLDTVQGGTDASRRHTLESVRDGASFTVMLSENINVGPNSSYNSNIMTTNWACPHPLNTSFFVNPIAVFGDNDPIAGEAVVGPASPGPNGSAGLYNYGLANNRGSIAPPANPPITVASHNQGGINGDITGINEGQFPYPTSGHPGGVHVVMCDGGVRFIPENISGEVWARIITPNGGALTRGNMAAQSRQNFDTAPSGILPNQYDPGNRQSPLSESDIPSG
jgi:prepilin-type N-terminal cleavage/methylation domain-containing protein